MQKHIVYDIYFHKINQYYNLQKLKKMRKMHFFQLSSLITFKILQIGHFWGVLPPCFTSLAIRKIILRHPKCLQKNSKACFFPLVRCGRDGTENPSFTQIRWNQQNMSLARPSVWEVLGSILGRGHLVSSTGYLYESIRFCQIGN